MQLQDSFTGYQDHCRRPYRQPDVLPRDRRCLIMVKVKFQDLTRVCLNGEVKMPTFERTFFYRAADGYLPLTKRIVRIDHPCGFRTQQNLYIGAGGKCDILRVEYAQFGFYASPVGHDTFNKIAESQKAGDPFIERPVV